MNDMIIGFYISRKNEFDDIDNVMIVMMMKMVVVVKMFKIDLLALMALTSLRWHCFAFKSWISHQNMSRFEFPTRICQELDFLPEFVKS